MAAGTDWPMVALASHADLIAGFAFKSSQFTDDPNDIPLVKGADVQQGYIDWAGCRRWPRRFSHHLDRFWLRQGDVVLAMDRPWVPSGLKWAWIKRDAPPSLLVQRVARLRGTSGLFTDFLRYLIGSPQFTDFIRPITTGVNVPHISGAQILGFRFRLPPVATQRKIAAILSAYDDLIENNLRRIKILEEMAQNLYREWFVKFRFPGHEHAQLVDSPLGLIPEGWNVKSIGELCVQMQSGGTPSRKRSEFWDGGAIDWYKTMELWDSFLYSSEEKITDAGLKGSSAKLYEPGTVLMAIYGSPTVGRLGILTRRAACNQAALGMVANPSLASQQFLYYTLYELRGHFNSIAQGAAQQNISKAKVAEAHCILPPESLMRQFSATVVPIWGLLENRRKANDHLRRTRDLLLPKLISGELDVSNLDIAVPEATG